MKKAKKVLSVILSLIIFLCVPFNASAFSTSTIFVSSNITHNDRFSNYSLYQGVDISYHNGTVNWAKMKAAGVQFVILRAGNRFAQTGKIGKDSQFDNYIKGAHSAGLKIGIYFYSQALSEAEAKEEAEFTLSVINPYKDYITLPVAYDYEFAEVSKSRLTAAFNDWKASGTHKARMTANCEAFCDTIAEAGYDPMIYASKTFFEDNLNYSSLQKKYTIWVAHYINASKGRLSTDYKGDYNLWQFSSTGKISGVSGYVDSNFMYALPTVEEIPDQEYTGSPVEPDVSVTDGIRTLKKNTDYTVAYYNNVEYGTATAVVNGLDKYKDEIDETLTFNILPQTVKNLSVINKGDGILIFNWSPTADADGYQIESIDCGRITLLGEVLQPNASFAYTIPPETVMNCFRVRAYKYVKGILMYGKYSNTITLSNKVQGVTTINRKANLVKLQWEPLGNTVKYCVYKYSSSEGKWELIATTKKVRYNVKNLKANTKYKFKIKPIMLDENGEEVVGKASAAHVSFTLPAAPALRSVKPLAKRKITASWDKLSGISGYEIMWSTTKNFKSNTKTLTVKKSKGTATFQAVNANKTYYVKIRSYKVRSGKKYYSSWSKKLKVKTKK